MTEAGRLTHELARPQRKDKLLDRDGVGTDAAGDQLRGAERSPRVRHDHQVPPRPSGKESQGSSDDAAVSDIQRRLFGKPQHLMPGSARIAHQ